MTSGNAIIKIEKMKYLYILLFALVFSCCSVNKAAKESQEEAVAMGPVFSADSAYLFCQKQCDFGFRTMNSPSHEACGDWIARKFASYGLQVTEQRATLTGWDATKLQARNIIAAWKPEVTTRILVAAHWDSRPWADNDPDEANHKKPLMAANDGASGVAVMLELARLLSQADTTLSVGVDFVCFDAEDWGVPQWASDNQSGDDTWALGAAYWARNPHKAGYEARFGVLLDMVGGEGAVFYKEGYSAKYAPEILRKVWQAAGTLGFGGYFNSDEGGYITDDHVPVNEALHIPMIDIVPYYPSCQESSFGPTWHTVGDTMDHISKETLQVVGQTMVQVIFQEK